MMGSAEMSSIEVTMWAMVVVLVVGMLWFVRGVMEDNKVLREMIGSISDMNNELNDKNRKATSLIGTLIREKGGKSTGLEVDIAQRVGEMVHMRTKDKKQVVSYDTKNRVEAYGVAQALCVVPNAESYSIEVRYNYDRYTVVWSLHDA